MSGADCDALFFVEDRCQIVRVDIGELEADGSTAFVEITRAVDLEVGNRRQRLQGVAGDLDLVRPHFDHLEIRQVVDRRPEPDGLGYRRRSRLEFVRYRRPS